MAIGAIMGQQKANSQLSNLSNNQKALYNIGAGVRPNIFINPFFKVNQRGKNSYPITSPVYTLDCWKSSGTTRFGTIAPSGSAVRLNNNNGTMGISQLIDEYSSLAGKTVTVSFLAQIASGQYRIVVNDGTQNATTDMNFRAGDLTLYSFTVTISNSPSQLRCAFESVNSGNATIYAAKLELGESQTLAYQDSTGTWNLLPQPESDYLTQLLKCQQYFYQINVSNALDIVFNGFVTTNSQEVIVYVPFLENFKGTPIVSFNGGVTIRTSQGYSSDATYTSPYTTPVISVHKFTLEFSKTDHSKWNIPGGFNDSVVSVNFMLGTVLSFSSEL